MLLWLVEVLGLVLLIIEFTEKMRDVRAAGFLHFPWYLQTSTRTHAR